MIEAAVFDIGGVLAHDVWEHLLVDRTTGVLSVCELDAAAVTQTGHELWEAFAYQPAAQPEEWQQFELSYWNEFIRRFRLSHRPDVFVDMTAHFIRPVPGMIALLERLQARGIKLAICSNNNEFWFQRQMDQLNLHRFFSPRNSILSCRVGVSKSSPGLEMFHAVTDALNVEPSSCVFIDDRAGNIERALGYGMTGIYFPSHAPYGAAYVEALLVNMGI